MTYRIPESSRNYTITRLGQDKFACAVMIQDGWERWEEKTLDKAVQSVIGAAKTLNGAELTEKNISIACPRRPREKAVEPRDRKPETMPGDGVDAADENILRHLADAGNGFVATGQTHPDDLPDFRRAIHDAERILAARRMRRIDPDRWPSYNQDGRRNRP